MVKPKSWGDVHAPTNYDEGVRRVDEIFGDNYYKLPENRLVRLRLIGDQVIPIGYHWIDIITQRGKKVSVGSYCPAFDQDTETADLSKAECKACEHDYRLALRYVTTAIVRDKQKAGERNPVYVIELPLSVATQLITIAEMNIVRKKSGEEVPVPVSHPKFGCDIYIKYDPKKSGGEMYFVNKGDRSPLTKRERAYELPDMSELLEELEKKDLMQKRVADLVKKAASGGSSNKEEDENVDWDDGEVEDADWEDGEDFEDEEDNFDGDADDFEAEDFDEDEEDFEDEDFADDDDLGDDVDDFDDDEPPFDLEDEEEYGEEETPPRRPRRKKKKAKKKRQKPSRNKKKPAAKKKKAKQKAKAKRRRRR